ncbi:hypothetical protein QBC32DRAFT_174745, partial [Pseudoneurospora amorphoporcata]
KGEFDNEDPLFDLSDALKTFGVKYEMLALGESKNGDLNLAWHNYFVLSLRKLARDLPPNNRDGVFAAIEKLQREDIEVKAKGLGGHVSFPSP